MRRSGLDNQLGELGGVIDCLGVPTFVRTVGRGPSVFVFHGGPGFDQNYLHAPLASLAARRTLIFYDQPGCGQTGVSPIEPSAAFVFQHARALIEMLLPPGNDAGVIAHSWGALVYIAAHSELSGNRRFREGLMIAPTAVVRSTWDTAVAQLLTRIPPEVVGAFMGSLEQPSGKADFALIAPYYGTPLPQAWEGRIEIASQAYLAGVSSLGSFDERRALGEALRSVHVLLGHGDFTTEDLIIELTAAAALVHRTHGGHFPFWGSPVEFGQVLDLAFKGDPAAIPKGSAQ